jgi:hypothetical protein
MNANAIDIARIRERVATPVPNPAQLLNLALLDTYLIGVAICLPLKPMVTSAVRGRELTLKEAYEGVADCLLPIIGSIIVRATFPDRWNKLPTKLWPKDLSIASQS